MSGHFRDTQSGAAISSRVDVLIGALLVCVMVLIGASDAWAQQAIRVVNGVVVNGEEDPGAGVLGFTVRGADEEMLIALSDLERHLDNGAWERAFGMLDQFEVQAADALAPGPDGLYLPLTERLAQMLRDMPAEGRAAFELFRGGKSRQLARQMDEAQQRGDLEAQLALAKTLFDQFLITEAGARAANLLGDAAFEAGQFNDAARYWQALIDAHPNGSVSEAALHAKRATALWRGGRLDEFEQLRSLIDRRFGDESMRIAGYNIRIRDYLEELSRDTRAAAARQAASQDVERGGAGVVNGAPVNDAPIAWRMQFVGDAMQRTIAEMSRNRWEPSSGMQTLVPARGSDGERLYCNWIGIRFAVDLASGKLVWRSHPFTELNERIDHFQHRQTNFDRYTLTVAEGHVLATMIPLDRLNHWQEPVRLVVHEADTGKMTWNSGSVSQLDKLDFIGAPLVLDGQVLTIVRTGESTDLKLQAMALSNGQPAWSIELGTAQASEGHNWGGLRLYPALLHDQGTLYVLTGNGALLAVDLERKAVQWAFKYDPPPIVDGNHHRFWNQPASAIPLQHSPSMLLRDGVLYFKEADSSTMHAVDLATRRALWERPVAAASIIVGLDDEMLYLLDRELIALDRQTRAMRWSSPLPIAVGGLSAIVGDDRLMAFTNRGIYELDKRNGDRIRIFRHDDLPDAGGWLAVHGNQFLMISPTGMAAYPLPDREPLEEQAAEP